MTLHNVKSFLQGEDLLDEMNSSLQDFSNQETLMELLAENDEGSSWSLAQRNVACSNWTDVHFLLYFFKEKN